MLVTVIELVEPLATSHSAQLASHASPDLPPLAIHPMAFRQILVVLLGYAIETGAGGLITLQVRPEKWKLVFEVSFTKASIALLRRCPHSTQAQELVELFHGDLAYAPGPAGAVLRLTLPIFEQQIVFLIDDNPDIAQLFSRYMAGTRFRVHASQDPAGALQLLESLSPSIIVLDVMMPHIDGWDMLKKIHSHPQAAGIPGRRLYDLEPTCVGLRPGRDGFPPEACYAGKSAGCSGTLYQSDGDRIPLTA